jgi:opacity protein-like surface antigen
MRVRSVCSAVAAAVTVFVVSAQAPAQAQVFGGASAGKWFVEGNVGGAWADYDSFKVSGALVEGGSSSSASFAGGVGTGFYFTNQIYAKLSYKYFGSFDDTGSYVGIPVGMDVSAHGLMVGLGFNYDLSRELFLEATGEIGVAFLDTSGRNFNGLALGSNTQTNFAGGVGLGLGYRVTRNMDLLVMGNYHWLGDAGVSGSGVDLSARDLDVVSATIGARIRF